MFGAREVVLALPFDEDQPSVLGFDIEQLVHEFIVLRRSIVGVVSDKGVDVDATVVSLLADLIDAPIATSVRSYIDSRDYESRKQEAEHIGFITHELRNPLSAVVSAPCDSAAEVAARVPSVVPGMP